MRNIPLLDITKYWKKISKRCTLMIFLNIISTRHPKAILQYTLLY